jgi:oxygen-independent coproporphyrinogen-3 oxidase
MTLGTPDERPSPQGIYVHFPFCLSKCKYCSFNSSEFEAGLADAYVNALMRDIENEAARWAGTGRFTTIYFGGGTPSLASELQLGATLRSLQRGFDVDPAAEVTVECNPATVDRAKLAAFKRLGVTRLSIGVQSLCDRELGFLGRAHTRTDALETLEAAREAGFTDVSVDLMIGIAGQTRSSLRATLAGVLGRASHLSIYILSVEAGTPLECLVASREVVLPGEEAIRELYGFAADLLAAKGFLAYEISNYSLPGCTCRHNEIYWRRGNYAGLGAGAHSHRNGWRYSKMRLPHEYIASVLTTGEAIDMSEHLSAGQMLLEDVMLAMRTRQGLDHEVLALRYGLDAGRLGRVLAGLAGDGLVVREGNFVALSPKGILVGDAVVAEIASSLAPAAP